MVLERYEPLGPSVGAVCLLSRLVEKPAPT